ncbi:MAG: histone deacetylase [Myxococcales bacterium]|nr:MAG: histone deacetylase [Myxococcales bacterium]
MSEQRLAAYLEGGVPPGGRRANPGARDRTLPRRSLAVDLPGGLYFAGDSPQWGGGVAFYDHDATEQGPTPARAYLMTAQQFADVAAQEMYRLPQQGDPLEEIVIGGIDGGRHHVGPGHYETLIEVGRIESAPMLLFTAPHGIDHVEHTQPSTAYLAMLAKGLRESRAWDDERVAAHFRGLGVG